LLIGRKDIEIITFPHDLNQWREEDLTLAKTHNVFEDLQKTAPVLWLDGEKKNRISQNPKMAPRCTKVTHLFFLPIHPNVNQYDVATRKQWIILR
jgi:hypothetical protein